MAAVFWILLGTLWWYLALTVALPLTLGLMVSERFRRAFFPWWFMLTLYLFFDRGTTPLRKKAFQILKDSVGHRSRPLEVLEIGVGSGANLEYYPDNVNLTVLDRNKFFEVHFRENAKKFPHISYQRTVIQQAEDMSQIEDNSFDVVVSTYLLCSCENARSILQEVKRVLKPGGKYVFLEHIRAPRGDPSFYLQKFISALWKLYFVGCTLDRDTDLKIQEAGFSSVQCHRHNSDILALYPIKHMILGTATK